jgi:hypothetical protein
MTQDKNEGSENLNWMEIAETDAINEVRHNGQRLPFVAAAVSLLIIGGGAVFAQTNNESPAQAEETSVSRAFLHKYEGLSREEGPIQKVVPFFLFLW